MNSYYKTLELHKILEMLANETSNAKTREMALNIAPSTDLDEVCLEVKKTSDALELSSRYGTPNFLNIKDVSASLKKAGNGASLSLRELLDVAQVLVQVRYLTDWRKQCENIETSIGYLFSELSPNKYLEEKILSSIISEEEIADDASLELASIRRKIAQAGAKIRETMEKMLRSSSVQKCLQDAVITIRDGRYVLPVKAENKNSVPGLVHDTSSSGATLFIEPISVVEANNEIRVLKGREQEEIERIIAELSSECAQFAESINKGFSVSVELNLYFAKANLAARMRATAPVISNDGKINLKNARHPLIDKDKVVPININLGYDYQVLVITGPNTGGKTVALKTAGLLCSMVMCGLLIPVSDGSKVSVFKNILVDIGDEQSIEQSLSTFSSHMNKVIRILKEADENSLVLLDELGSGTDPVEGAALAVAIIEKLKSKGSKMLVTTHYQELKLYAIETSGVQNASCEFDVATLQPTYRLIVGSPGKSNAFAISARLGIPSDIIEYAKNLVSNENKRFEEVVGKLEKARQELEKQNEEIKRLKNEHEEKLQKLHEEIERFDKSKDAEFEKARIQAMRIIENVRMQSEKLIDELDALRKEKEKENFASLALNAKSSAKSLLDKMYNEANPVREKSNDDYVLPRPLKRGDHVLIFDINKKGILASDPDENGFVFVQSGIMKTKVNISKLRLMEPERTAPQTQSKKISTKNVKSKLERKVQMELDIRGKNSDDGIYELGMFLDNAVLSGVGLVTVIHGKGTGILRSAVHKYLKGHPSVKSFRLGVYGEGEDGVTIVELK